jgi:hypothetical protein
MTKLTAALVDDLVARALQTGYCFTSSTILQEAILQVLRDEKQAMVKEREVISSIEPKEYQIDGELPPGKTRKRKTKDRTFKPWQRGFSR